MDRWGNRIDRFISVALSLALMFMFVLIFTNVLLRFIFSSGVTVAEEYARFAFLWTTFLGAYLAVRENQHIGIAGIQGFVSIKYHWIIETVVNAIKLLILSVVIVGSWHVLIANLGGRAPASGAPVAIAFASVVVGMAALLGIFAYRIFAVIIGRFRGDEK